MRKLIDHILQTGIKLCLLSGVAFTFAACYGPAPNPERWEKNAPEFRQDQQQLEQQLAEAAEEAI